MNKLHNVLPSLLLQPQYHSDFENFDINVF